MKISKLRPLFPKGAVKICCYDNESKENKLVFSDIFRSMDAVPESYDKCKVTAVIPRDDITIKINENEEKKVRGFQIVVEEIVKGKKKKDKKKKKIKINENTKLEGTDEYLLIDPSLDKDPIEKSLNK